MADEEIDENDEGSRQLLDDLIEASSIPESQLRRLSERLVAETGFPTVPEVVASEVSNPTQAEVVTRLLLGLEEDSMPELLEMISDWRASSVETQEMLPQEKFNALSKNLSILFPHASSIVRTKKAYELLTATGNEVKGVRFVCDARPVFNKSRTEVDGFVLITTLKIHFESSKSESKEIEFVLTPSELDAFIDEAADAKKKINVLAKKLSQFLPIGFATVEQ